MSRVTVHVCPPAYPRALHPFRCPHDPKFQLASDGGLQRDAKGRATAWLADPICIACGRPVPTPSGTANLVLTVSRNLAEWRGHGVIAHRLLYLRDRYLRIATRIFDADGWTGRHRKWAELIDPLLTMKVRPAGRHGDGTQFVGVTLDEQYFADGADGRPRASAGASSAPQAGAGRSGDRRRAP